MNQTVRGKGRWREDEEVMVMVMVGGRGQTESVEALEDRLEMPSARGCLSSTAWTW